MNLKQELFAYASQWYVVGFFDLNPRNRLSPVDNFIEVLLLVGSVFRTVLGRMAVTACRNWP